MAITRASIFRMVAFLCVVAAALYASYRIDQASVKNLESIEGRTCVRVQFLRDQANGTNFLIYDTFRQVVEQQRAVIKSGKLKGAALRQAEQSVRRAESVVKTTVVTGPTDCHQAVYNNNYKAPAPEFIYRHGPHVKAARAHAADIIRKARLHVPLYDTSREPKTPRGK